MPSVDNAETITRGGGPGRAIRCRRSRSLVPA